MNCRNLCEWASLVVVLGLGCQGNRSGGRGSSTGGVGAGGSPTTDAAITGTGAAGAGPDTDGGNGSGGMPPTDGPTGTGFGSGGQIGGMGGQAGSPVGTGNLIPTRLRTELRENPLGIQTATPRLAWEIESSDEKARGQVQTGYEVLVASSSEKLAADQGDLWSSGIQLSSESNTIYAGQTLASLVRVTWKVRVRDGAGQLSPWSAPGEWTVGLLSAADWGAQWITGGGSGAALPIFRREFQITKAVSRALVSACGLGQFELRVNGVNASDAVMEPSWTNFTKTCHYSTYDITKAVVQGGNAIGVLLGNGMYNVPANSRYTKFTASFGAPQLIAHVQVDYTDGSKSSVVTDTSWKAMPGPITFTNIYGGEDFDARLEPSGWDKAGFADTAWAAVTVVGPTGPRPALVARSAPPVKVMQDFAPTQVTQPLPGVFVYDLGQNFSGWPEITLSGAAGVPVRMTPAELVNASGTLNPGNVGSPVWWAYTPKGTAPETWHPRFAYTGFRYIQIEGAVPAAQAASFPGRPQITALTGKFLHASAENVGTFTSSDQDLNKIHALILAAIRSNLQNILTDCPQREKLGWLETSHLLATSIAYDYDVAAFYEKIIRDMSDAQTTTGLVTDIAPEYPVFAADFRDSPEWGSAFVINPWFVYQTYGDRQPLDEHYANMKRYVTYLGGKAVQNIISYGLGDWYDVGPNPPGVSQLTSAGFTATAIWLQDLAVLRQTATLLGKTDEAAQFQTTETAVTAAFNARFLNASGTYDQNSQTANAMALALGLVPAAQRVTVLGNVAAGVVGAQNRVTAGDIGFVYLLRALYEAGRGDVVYGLLKQSTGPGYLYQISHGATALTEAWDARVTSSQNHAMLGHAEEWLYRGLAGINPDPVGPGFKKFIVKPQVQTGLASVDAQYHSIHGVIASHWQQGPSGITMSVSVPVNTTATIYLPTNNPTAVTEGGAAVASAPGVTSTSQMTGTAILQVGSGHYTFSAP